MPTLQHLRQLAHDGTVLAVFDALVPEIAELGEIEMLVLAGLFLVDGQFHQALHVCHIFRFGR
jgi:hypothetical protein